MHSRKSSRPYGSSKRHCHRWRDCCLARNSHVAVCSPAAAHHAEEVLTADLARTVPVIFIAYDVLYADGQMTIGAPIEARRGMLAAALSGLPLRILRPVDRIDHGWHRSRIPCRSGAWERRPCAQTVREVYTSQANVADPG